NLEEREFCQVLLEAAAELLQADSGLLILHDTKNNQWKVAAKIGQNRIAKDEVVNPTTTANEPFAFALARAVLSNQQSLLIAEVQSHAKYAKHPEVVAEQIA